jgi:hypothetical protein
VVTNTLCAGEPRCLASGFLEVGNLVPGLPAFLATSQRRMRANGLLERSRHASLAGRPFLNSLNDHSWRREKGDVVVWAYSLCNKTFTLVLYHASFDGYQLAVGHCPSLGNGKDNSPTGNNSRVRSRAVVLPIASGEVLCGVVRLVCELVENALGASALASIAVDIDPGQCGIKEFG